MKNILLIGLPGSGKSFFGKALAEKFAMEFVDLDQLIVQREGLDIDKIFKGKGEEAFRLVETAALKTMEARKNTIIATGGGIIIRQENRELLDRLGVTVFLSRDPKNILADVNLADRPLLKDNPKRLEELHKTRLPLYLECADFVVDSNRSREEVMKQLTDLVNLGERGLRLAVIGDPIAHSLSPEIHKNILGPFVKKIDYEKIKIEKGNLKKTFNERFADLDGFNVTMPHKADIIKFIDEVEAKALEMQSVNTVVLRDRAGYGYSTDGAGIRMALEKLGRSFKNAHVMIFGSGGAGTVAAEEAAAGQAAKVEVFSRQGGDGKFSSYSELEAQASGAGMQKTGLGKACDKTGKASILINASPMGMAGFEELPDTFPEALRDYSFLDGLKENGAVLDMVYHPDKTKLLLEAEKRRIPACNGLFMLIGQAIEADNIFLGMGEGIRLGVEKAYERALKNAK